MLPLIHTKLEIIAHFLSLIVRDSSSQCWAWSGRKNAAGTPIFNSGKKFTNTILAKRFSFIVAFGEISTDDRIASYCASSDCVYPHHLKILQQDPAALSVNLSTLEQRFRQRIEKNATTRCWNWRGRITEFGYGVFPEARIPHGTTKAHRFSYLLHTGQIAADLCIDHLCRNRACVNPAHLEAVTPAINTMRGFGRGAINARMTHCQKCNSDFYRHTDGRRYCRKCRGDRSREKWRQNNWPNYQKAEPADAGPAERED